MERFRRLSSEQNSQSRQSRVDRFVDKWQRSKIVTPVIATGAIIVAYRSFESFAAGDVKAGYFQLAYASMLAAVAGAREVLQRRRLRQGQ